MCGIAGVFNLTGLGADAPDIRRAVEVMRHRGPDETGFFANGQVSLGMCRLAIIAPDGNHQPATNEDGSVQVVFNGQIYNHPSLRGELEGLGHRFASDGDTEVIAHAYEQWGDEFLDRLNGMFAIAVYDGRDGGRLLLARDRVGIKPLHYHVSDGRIVFGSEVKTVLALLESTPGLNVEGMLSLLTFEYLYAPHTMFQGICKLEPGCLLVHDRRGEGTRRYWSLAGRCREMDEPQARRRLRDLMGDAVRSRMISDVPLGAFLSGGIDSSIIVALMSACADRPVRTFSVGFEESSYDETGFAKMVADRYRTEHVEIRLRMDFDELMKPIEMMLDDPIGDFSVFSTYLVSRAAREHVTVVLSGDGGDELFGGYDTYIADRVSRLYGMLGPWFGRRCMPWLLSFVRPSPTKKGLVNRAKVFVAGAARAADLGHARWMVFADEKMRGGLLSDEFAEQAAAIDPTDHVRRLRAACDAGESSERAMYVDSAFYLPDNILHKVDRTSMACSLETRVPMLDHRVVELALSMPGRWRVRGLETKSILRSTFADLLPEAILRRGKQGFSTPMKHWLRNELRTLMRDTLSPEALKRQGVFRSQAVERLTAEHLSGRADHAHVLWSLILCCMWLTKFQEGRVGAVCVGAA